MATSEFKDRLERIGAVAAPNVAALAPKPVPMAREGGRREKIARALRRLEAEGLGGARSYPPAYRALAAIGLPPRPIPYQSALTLGLIGGLGLFAIFGGLYASGLPAMFSRGPLAGLHSGGWIGVALVSVAGAVAIPLLTKLSLAGKRLPRWEDL